MDQALRQSFTPEFLGRLDRVVHFRTLDSTAMEAIAQKYLDQLQKRVGEQDIQLKLPQKLAQLLVQRSKEKGGARAIRRLVQEEVEGPLATFLLECSRRPARIAGEMTNACLSFQIQK